MSQPRQPVRRAFAGMVGRPPDSEDVRPVVLEVSVETDTPVESLTLESLAGLPVVDILRKYNKVHLTPEEHAKQLKLQARREADRLRKQKARKEKSEKLKEIRDKLKRPLQLDPMSRGKFMTDAPKGKGELVNIGDKHDPGHTEKIAAAATRAQLLGKEDNSGSSESNGEGGQATWPEHDRRRKKPDGAAPDSGEDENDEDAVSH